MFISILISQGPWDAYATRWVSPSSLPCYREDLPHSLWTKSIRFQLISINIRMWMRTCLNYNLRLMEKIVLSQLKTWFTQGAPLSCPYLKPTSWWNRFSNRTGVGKIKSEVTYSIWRKSHGGLIDIFQEIRRVAWTLEKDLTGTASRAPSVTILWIVLSSPSLRPTKIKPLFVS